MQVFTQTRGGSELPTTLQECILNPRASFGGLHTLLSLPPLPSLGDFLPLDYASLTHRIFSHLGLEIDGLDDALESYTHFDDPLNPAPLSKLDSHLYLQELYHGPSRAFKDMAIQPLGRLFSHFTKEQRYLLLSATSGDTGPATLESFKGVKNIQVVCLYPQNGTSDVQRLQMSTQIAPNLKVIPIIGNFDDAQQILKFLLQDEDFLHTLQKQNIQVSVSNSINFGRIIFQIIYHIWGYFELVRQEQITLGDKISSVIPSGNFGNALGAFYAKIMGLPIQKITIASNANHVLTDFIQSGIYDLSNRSLLQTYSPAMDILKSSNIERILFALFGSTRTKELMQSLDTQRSYALNANELQILQSHFNAGFCTDTECLKAIQALALEQKIIDPHTATAYVLAKTLPPHQTILISSTAEWTKFSPTIAYAITGEKFSDKKALQWISREFNLPITEKISSLFAKQEYLPQALRPQEVKQAVLQWLS